MQDTTQRLPKHSNRMTHIVHIDRKSNLSSLPARLAFLAACAFLASSSAAAAASGRVGSKPINAHDDHAQAAATTTTIGSATSTKANSAVSLACLCRHGEPLDHCACPGLLTLLPLLLRPALPPTIILITTSLAEKRPNSHHHHHHHHQQK